MQNQLIRIQIRFIHLITGGCLIDGLVPVASVSPLRFGNKLYGDDSSAVTRDCTKILMVNLFGWLERSHRLRHLQLSLNCLHPQQS